MQYLTETQEARVRMGRCIWTVQDWRRFFFTDESLLYLFHPPNRQSNRSLDPCCTEVPLSKSVGTPEALGGTPPPLALQSSKSKTDVVTDFTLLRFLFFFHFTSFISFTFHTPFNFTLPDRRIFQDNDRPTVNDVRVTSCSVDFDQKG